VVSRPLMSTTQILARAPCSDRPSAAIDRTTCSQTPMPSWHHDRAANHAWFAARLGLLRR
jgi:hypothetical protein